MKNLARNLFLVSCMGSSVTAAPFLAIGDNAELFAVGDASVVYNDNIQLDSSGNELEDVIFTARPGFELQFGKESLISGSLNLNTTLTSYADNDQLNNQLLGIGGRIAYSSGALVSFSAHASYNELDQTIRDTGPLVTDIEATLVERAVTSAGFNGEFAYSEKFSVGSGFSFGKVDYKTSTSVEQEDYSVPVNVYYELTPKVDLSAGVSYKHTDLATASPGGADQYDDFYYNVGARGEFTPKLSGSFNVGYTTRNGNRGEDSDGTIGASSSLSYAYSDKTQLSLSLNRDFGTSSSNGESFENTSVTLSALNAIAVDWTLNAAISYRMLDYDAYTNDYIDGSVGASYTINEHLTASVGYSYRQQFSDLGSASEFKNHVVSLSLSARY